jgi:hypothetical protein
MPFAPSKKIRAVPGIIALSQHEGLAPKCLCGSALTLGDDTSTIDRPAVRNVAGPVITCEVDMNKTPKKNVLDSVDGTVRRKPRTKPSRPTPSVSEAEGVSDPKPAGIDVTPSQKTRAGCREPFALVFTRQGGRLLSPDDEFLGSNGQPALRKN